MSRTRSRVRKRRRIKSNLKVFTFSLVINFKLMNWEMIIDLHNYDYNDIGKQWLIEMRRRKKILSEIRGNYWVLEKIPNSWSFKTKSFCVTLLRGCLKVIKTFYILMFSYETFLIVLKCRFMGLNNDSLSHRKIELNQIVCSSPLPPQKVSKLLSLWSFKAKYNNCSIRQQLSLNFKHR